MCLFKNGINIRFVLLIGVVFFMPCTIVRFCGLKISEILICLLFLCDICFYSVILHKNYVIKFSSYMCVIIAFSWLLSLLDPFSQFRTGIENGVYYSFEFGAPLKLVRLFLVVYFFNCIAYFRNYKNIFFLLNTYVVSNFILDVYVNFNAVISNGIYSWGVDRTAVLAQEPSEAGFINAMAIIVIIGYIQFSRYGRKYLMLLVGFMFWASLNIGSAASVAFACLSVILVFGCYYCFEKNYKIYNLKVIAFIGIIIISASVLIFNTNLFDKILFYDYYMNQDGSSILERITAVEVAWNLFLERPLLGVGWGNYGWYVEKFNDNPFFHVIGGGAFSANNQYAVFLSELGIIGLALFCIFITYNVIVIYKNLQKTKEMNNEFKSLLYILSGEFVYLLLSGITLNMFYSFQFWLTIAGIVLLKRNYIN